MKYFSLIIHNYVCKNKLQEAVYQFLKSQDRVIWANLETTKKMILYRIGEINKEFPRCKPIIVSWYTGMKQDWSLSNVGVCSFTLYEIDPDREVEHEKIVISDDEIRIRSQQNDYIWPESIAFEEGFTEGVAWHKDKTDK